jgi:HEPN domain-containing protein
MNGKSIPLWKAFMVIVFVLFVPYIIIASAAIVQFFMTQTATTEVWSSLSLLSDILGICSLILSTIFWMVGFRALSYEEVVKAAEEGVIHHPDFRSIYGMIMAHDDQLPEVPDATFTHERIERTANLLEKSGYFQSESDFRSAGKLLSDGFIEAAVIMTRRGLELFLRELLLKASFRVDRRTSVGQMIERLTEEKIISTDEMNLLRGFYSFANRVVHGDWKPDREEALTTISSIASLIELVAGTARERGIA